MPFKEAKRREWLAVANGQCQADFWVGDALIQCRHPAEHVHHIIPESELKAEGLDPNETVGLPLCRQHHVGIGGEVADGPWEPTSAMHPDMNQALEEYRRGNKEAFKHAASGHHQEIETVFDTYIPRFVTGDWEMDLYYTQKMLNLKNKHNQGGE